MPLWLVHSNVYSPKLKHFKVLKNLACRASTMSEIWLKNYQLFSNLQAFNFSVKFWRKTMRICVNRVTPLQNIHDSNLFFSSLSSFQPRFSKQRSKRNEGLFWPIIWQQRKFSLNLAALLCFAWVARIPCLSRSHRHQHQLQHNYKQTFDCEGYRCT